MLGDRLPPRTRVGPRGRRRSLGPAPRRLLLADHHAEQVGEVHARVAGPVADVLGSHHRHVAEPFDHRGRDRRPDGRDQLDRHPARVRRDGLEELDHLGTGDRDEAVFMMRHPHAGRDRRGEHALDGEQVEGDRHADDLDRHLGLAHLAERHQFGFLPVDLPHAVGEPAEDATGDATRAGRQVRGLEEATDVRVGADQALGTRLHVDPDGDDAVVLGLFALDQEALDRERLRAAR